MIAISPTWAPDAETIHVPDELMAYFQNKFCAAETHRKPVSTAEPYIDAWQGYITKFNEGEAFQLLQKCYPQLNFPIEEGINKTQTYIDAVLKGKPQATGGTLSPLLDKPETLKIKLHNGIAGKVPVLFCGRRPGLCQARSMLFTQEQPGPYSSVDGGYAGKRHQ